MKTTDFIKENFVADAAEAHQDHEVQMARADCYNAAKYAVELHKLLKNISEQEGLEGWVSEKITLANDYLRTVTEYLRYEQQAPSSDMPEFDVGSATQTLDAALGEGILDMFKNTDRKMKAPIARDEPGKVSFSDLGKNAMFDPKDRRTTDDQRVFYEFMLGQKNKSTPDDFINTLNHYTRKYKDAIRKEGGSNPHNSGRLKVLNYLETQAASQPVHEDDYDDAIADFLAKNKPIQGKTHPPRAAERLGGSRHIAGRGEAGRGKVGRLGKSAKSEPVGKPVVTAEGDTNFGHTVTRGSWVVYDGSKLKRFKSHEGAKAYAEKNGGKVASSEHYADKIQGKQGVTETAGGMGAASVATSMGGGNGFVNGGPGTISRPKMKKKK